MKSPPDSKSPGARPAFGVVLANIGSPAAPTARAVRPYLRQFLGDRRVVDLPRWRWWPILNLFILPLRSPRSAELYRGIWTAEGSPLLVTTRRLGERLARRLIDRLGCEIPVAVGMRYGEPSIGSALRRLAELECSRIIILPLFPQYSRTTSESVSDAVSSELESWKRRPELRTIRSYPEHPAYLSAVAESIRRYWADNRSADRLLISFHGLPRRYADAGDPYPQECATTAKALAARLELAPGRWHMAYQSRFGREPWLRPELEGRLARWGRRGASDIDVVCPGFAADCLETLEEVAVANRQVFENAGGRGYRYIPALNDSSEHAAALAEIIGTQTEGWFA